MLIWKHWSHICPFCRGTGEPENDEERVQRLYDRINIRNDEDYTVALMELGRCFDEGIHGLPQSIQKAEELFQQAYDLDNPIAAY